MYLFLSMVVEVQSFHIVPSHRARAEFMTPPCPPIYAKIGNNEAIQTSRKKKRDRGLASPPEANISTESLLKDQLKPENAEKQIECCLRPSWT